jgi:hypothetical protein
VHDDAPDELTLRAALSNRTTAPPRLLQQQVGTGRVLRVASRAGLDDLPGRALARARLGPGHAAGDHDGVLPCFRTAVCQCGRATFVRVRDADGGIAFEQRVETSV